MKNRYGHEIASLTDISFLTKNVHEPQFRWDSILWRYAGWQDIATVEKQGGVNKHCETHYASRSEILAIPCYMGTTMLQSYRFFFKKEE